MNWSLSGEHYEHCLKNFGNEDFQFYAALDKSEYKLYKEPALKKLFQKRKKLSDRFKFVDMHLLMTQSNLSALANMSLCQNTVEGIFLTICGIWP